MGRVVASEVITLDGVIEEPDRFAAQYESEEGTKAAMVTLLSADALVFGRVTYEKFAKTWPALQGTGAYALKMNGAQKYVLSRTLKTTEWSNSKILKGT